MKKQVIKRDGSVVDYDNLKIYGAIMKAMTKGSGIVREQVATDIAKNADVLYGNRQTISIFEIEEYVFDQLVGYGQKETARAYEGYRAIQSFKRETNTTDESILGLVNFTNEEVMNENSNKDGVLASTQRDLIAGEISKDITRRHLLPAHIVQAHDEGVIHYHK